MVLTPRITSPYASLCLVALVSASGCINGAPGQDGPDGGAAGQSSTFDDQGGGASGATHFSGAAGYGFNGTGARPSGGANGAAANVGGGGSAGGRPAGSTPTSGGASAGSAPANGGANSGASGGVSVGGQGNSGASGVCSDLTTTSCSSGTWPGGAIYYTFAGGVTNQASLRASMDRWEIAASQTIHFVEDASQTAKVTIAPCAGASTEASGYSGCTNGCTVALCDDIDHQLGHIIGLGHEHARYDRDHYVRDQGQCGANAHPARCGLSTAPGDFGPFDYQSAMLYPVTDPATTRWDGSPICPAYAGSACPISATGPGGAPTDGDGSAVVELYTPSWTRFVRTLDTVAKAPYDPGTLAPFSDDLAPSVKIPKTSSPALETWEGNSLAVYVRGEDDNVYKKYVTNGVWGAWESLGAPVGKGPVSDPAIVSWAPGRSDVVVLRDGIVYITSTPTWKTWQPLPAPPVAAASAPVITSWGPDRLDVFLRGVDDQVYWESCSGGCSGNAGNWSAWTAIYGGTIRGKPAAIARSGGIIDVFVHSMGDDLWSVRYTDSASPQWGGYAPLDTTKLLKWDPSCPDCCSPVAGSHDGTTSDVYIRTTTDAIATGSVGTSGWSGYTFLGGVSSGSPAVVAQVRTSKRTDLVIIAPEENDTGDLHHGTWSKSRTYP